MIGGIETHCEQLYPALARAAPDIELRLLARRPYAAGADYRFDGVRVTSLWSPARPAAETFVHTLLCLLYARVRLHPRIVHLHGIGPAFLAPLARMFGFRTIVTHHAADYERPKWGVLAKLFLRAGETMAARFADRVICVSDTLRREFVHRHPEAAARTVTIRHGLFPRPSDAIAAPDMFSELDIEPGRYILAVGRLEETKRFQDLIAAQRAMPQGSALVIVGVAFGDTKYVRALREMAGPAVRFAGYRNATQLAVLYRNAALFIHPSAMEGFGLVVLEALAADAPVKLSDIPVHREFGLPDAAYFPVGDVRAIAEILATDDHSQSRVVDKPGATHALRSAEASVEAHVEIYRSFMPYRSPIEQPSFGAIP